MDSASMRLDMIERLLVGKPSTFYEIRHDGRGTSRLTLRAVNVNARARLDFLVYQLADLVEMLEQLCPALLLAIVGDVHRKVLQLPPPLRDFPVHVLEIVVQIFLGQLKWLLGE